MVFFHNTFIISVHLQNGIVKMNIFPRTQIGYVSILLTLVPLLIYSINYMVPININIPAFRALLIVGGGLSVGAFAKGDNAILLYVSGLIGIIALYKMM